MVYHIRDAQGQPQLPSSCAIYVDGLEIGYGGAPVIEGLRMQVPVGSIYGLLGPSGCGKSTLLKVLLGRLYPEAGKVFALGSTPGTKGHIVPGRGVGYAPQEPALYNDITIDETFEFHARLHGLNRTKLQSRTKWLADFLDLPPLNTLVSKLSGGQNRRVSLAAALLHDPQLLILDEPTVGVDPLLRSRIWQHLVEVAKAGVTVIVTTHYIEEARQADCVGLMRNGRILDEGPPLQLMRKYNMETLEDVFLALCRKNDDDVNNVTVIHGETTPLLTLDSVTFLPTSNIATDTTPPVHDDKDKDDRHKDYSKDEGAHIAYSHNGVSLNGTAMSHSWTAGFLLCMIHIFAIAQRKSKQLIRNKKLLAFTVLTPAFQIFLFFIAIGPDPKGLNFAVVNQDAGINFGSLHYNLGAMVVNNMKSDIFNLHNYSDLDLAIAGVKKGKDWGVVYIPTNFTSDMQNKFISRDPNVNYQTTLHLYLDMSNYQITVLIQQKILEAFESMASFVSNITVSPIEIDEAVYGSTEVRFKNFLAPGMIALICFAHSIGITAVAFVREKNDGTMDRIYAAGVNSRSIIIGHYLISNVILMVQTGTLLTLVIFVFKVTIQGSIGWVIVILLALGGVGMSLGLLISGAATIETEAVQLSLSAYFPALLMSGVIWPVESIPGWMAWVSYGLPTTWAAQALRSIMIRGWGIENQQVWFAIVVILIWGISLIFIASLILKTHNIKAWCKKRK